MKISLNISDTKVIELSVARKSRELRRINHECTHDSVEVDTLYSKITCKKCNKELNPMAWLIEHVEYWNFIKESAIQYNEAIKKFEERSRTKCEHCEKMTRIIK